MQGRGFSMETAERFFFFRFLKEPKEKIIKQEPNKSTRMQHLKSPVETCLNAYIMG